VNKAIFFCLSVGAVGGAYLSLAGLVAPLTGLLLGSIYGLIFCLVARARVNTPGAGLLWGLAFALVFWLADSSAIGLLFVSAIPGSRTMLDEVRARFPDLAGYIIFFGAPLGIVLGTVNRGRARAQTGRSEIQLVARPSRRRLCGHPGRAGLWSVDGEG
jgi:hypothetical protein